MKKIEIEGISLSDLQQIIESAVEKVIHRIREEEKKPKDWEEITLEKAAEELSCSIRTVTRKMKLLKIKGTRVGKEKTLKRKYLEKIREAS